jgi:hypothetical protein
MEILAALVVVATLAAMASGRVPAVLALATGLAVAGVLRSCCAGAGHRWTTGVAG